VSGCLGQIVSVSKVDGAFENCRSTSQHEHALLIESLGRQVSSEECWLEVDAVLLSKVFENCRILNVSNIKAASDAEDGVKLFRKVFRLLQKTMCLVLHVLCWVNNNIGVSLLIGFEIDRSDAPSCRLHLGDERLAKRSVASEYKCRFHFNLFYYLEANSNQYWVRSLSLVESILAVAP
jgi:hypothetical protein